MSSSASPAQIDGHAKPRTSLARRAALMDIVLRPGESSWEASTSGPRVGLASMRLGAIFVAICMVLIAVSLGAVVHFTFSFTRLEAAVVAIAALTGLALFNAATGRARDRSDLGDQIADLSRATADLARQVGEIGRKVVRLEAEFTPVVAGARAASEPISAEIVQLSGILKELADAVAAHESVLIELTQGAAAVPAAIAPSAGSPGETAQTVDRAE